MDRTGGAWLLLGYPVERTTLACAFASDGCGFVSDDHVLVRRQDRKPSSVMLESWHRGHHLPADRADLVASAAMLLCPERWRPVAELRGVLIARASPLREDAPWRRVPRHEVRANLSAAAPHLHDDVLAEEYLSALLAVSADHPALEVTVDSTTPAGSGFPDRRLASVLDEMLH